MKDNKLHLLGKLGKHSSDEECLKLLFGEETRECPECKVVRKFYPVKGRKCYECGCGYQIFPLKGTIMKNTKLPLGKWFEAINMFSNNLNGVSAKLLERTLEISYRHAWALGHKIRKAMSSGLNLQQLTGIIEVDETYIGGKKKIKKNGQNMWSNKITVFGMCQRDGEVRAIAVDRRDKETIIPLIKANVEKGTTIYSDEHGIYQQLKDEGYKHDFVRHNNYKWAKGDVCTNAIEGYWSLLKRNIRGTYIHVSKKWLQRYLDEFSFRYNRRRNKKQIKQELLEIVYSSSIGRINLRIKNYS